MIRDRLSSGPPRRVSSPGFDELGFFPCPFTRFQYEVVVPGPDGAAFVVLARGDLDGDGETSLYQLRSDSAEMSVERGIE